jgi:uncharacterized membrane protein (UPF0127 family)
MTMSRVTKFSFIVLLFLQIDSGFTELRFESRPFELKGQTYQLEIADNQVRKQQGLMFRRELDKQAGMLFIYQVNGNHRIWMKNTLVPLAVFWLDENARIVDKKILKPCVIIDCPVYQAVKDSRYILELHPSTFKLFGIGELLPALTSSGN